MLTTTYLPREQMRLLQEIDAFRCAHPACIHNFGPEKAVYLHEHTQVERDENAIFLLAPRHDFHEIIFFVESMNQLPGTLAALIHKSGAEKRYRITLNYQQSDPNEENELVRTLFQSGFVRTKRLARIRAKFDETRKALCEKLAAPIPYTPEFARLGDEQEILDLLLEEFDPVADNLPTLAEIRENIEKQQVAIIRHEGKILSTHYFTIQNSIYYGWWDITRKEYRGDFLFLKIELFVSDHFQKNGIRFKRAYGWRDITNKRHKREDKLAGKSWESVFTDYLLWPGEASQ